MFPPGCDATDRAPKLPGEVVVGNRAEPGFFGFGPTRRLRRCRFDPQFAAAPGNGPLTTFESSRHLLVFVFAEQALLRWSPGIWIKAGNAQSVTSGRYRQDGALQTPSRLLVGDLSEQGVVLGQPWILAE